MLSFSKCISLPKDRLHNEENISLEPQQSSVLWDWGSWIFIIYSYLLIFMNIFSYIHIHFHIDMCIHIYIDIDIYIHIYIYIDLCLYVVLYLLFRRQQKYRAGLWHMRSCEFRSFGICNPGRWTLILTETFPQFPKLGFHMFLTVWDAEHSQFRTTIVGSALPVHFALCRPWMWSFETVTWCRWESEIKSSVAWHGTVSSNMHFEYLEIIYVDSR
jgi:hypothetical protein